MADEEAQEDEEDEEDTKKPLGCGQLHLRSLGLTQSLEGSKGCVVCLVLGPGLFKGNP